MTKSDRSWKRKLRTRALCDRYDVVSRTIDRWVQTGILPPPMIINNVRYWDEDEIDRRDQERMAEAMGGTGGARWRLSDGCKVDDNVARRVITNSEVVGAGDALFPDTTPQTWKVCK